MPDLCEYEGLIGINLSLAELEDFTPQFSVFRGQYTTTPMYSPLVAPSFTYRYLVRRVLYLIYGEKENEPPRVHYRDIPYVRSHLNAAHAKKKHPRPRARRSPCTSPLGPIKLSGVV